MCKFTMLFSTQNLHILRWNGTLKTVKFARKGHNLLEKNATIQFSGKVYSLLIIYDFARLGFWVAKGNGFVYGKKQPPKSCFLSETPTVA